MIHTMARKHNVNYPLLTMEMQNQISDCIIKTHTDTQITCGSKTLQVQGVTVSNKVPQVHYMLLSITPATQRVTMKEVAFTNFK